MPETQQQREHGYSESEIPRGGDPESRFRCHLSHAKQAVKEFKEDGSLQKFKLSMSRAKVALSVAKKAERPDLEKEAQHTMKQILDMADTRRDVMEARIVAAAWEENLEVKFEVQPKPGQNVKRLVSVGGVPIEDVVRLLEEDHNEQDPSSSGKVLTPALTDPHVSDGGDACGDDEGLWVPAPASTDARQLDTDAATGICVAQTPPALTKLIFKGRLIRDIRGKLATASTEAPRLRRKPKFTE